MKFVAETHAVDEEEAVTERDGELDGEAVVDSVPEPETEVVEFAEPEPDADTELVVVRVGDTETVGECVDVTHALVVTVTVKELDAV